jgi:hypothetical protein
MAQVTKYQVPSSNPNTTKKTEKKKIDMRLLQYSSISLIFSVSLYANTILFELLIAWILFH